MKVPVRITNDKLYARSPCTASWTDSKQRLNYIWVYAHTAPDELVPKRPFILRVAINKGAGVVAAAKQGKDRQGLNKSWRFELTLLPEEILDFLPWIVTLVKLYDEGSVSLIPEPPRPLSFKLPSVLLLHDAWTEKAWQQAA